MGTVLQTSPYGRGSRGTYGSGGEFDPFRIDVEDSKAIVAWMRKQSWYTGKFATIGGSYLSFTQWALMEDPPKDMVAAVATVSVHDGSRACWDTGSLNLDIVRWAKGICTEGESFFSWKALTRPRYEPIVQSATLAEDVGNYLGDKGLWIQKIIAKPDMRDPHYAAMQHSNALERVNLPILIITGCYDIFHEQSIDQYLRLKERGVNVAMTSGPWSHIKCAMSGRSGRECFSWIEEHLGGRIEAKREAAVQYFVTGSEQWKSAATYPPPTAPTTFYLQEDGQLKLEAVTGVTESSSFVFDPSNATPTIGGNALTAIGAVNDSALAKRKDVLVFETAPLETDLEFCGRPKIELEHSTSHPFADVFVRISDVEPNGKSTNVVEGYKRLDPKRDSDEMVRLVLNNNSHCFLQGRKIRVVIAGGNFPQYARNLGMGDEGSAGAMRSVEHTIHFGGENASRIEFPVVSVD
ncbi:galactose-binding domain-like protein [Paraphoma chrysanthemicola]|nr:galactose-binding domain-like protein [Paraphoma chrysanthemicola]